MKHLKRFSAIHSLLEQSNEATDNFKQELKEFCENNLAYLLDEGRLLVEDSRDKIVRVQISFDRYKDWNEIKDHIIPFFIRLTNRYKVVEKYTDDVDVYISTRKFRSVQNTRFKITDLIDNDNLEISDIDIICLFVEKN